MKTTFFALSLLLVPALTVANVKVDVTARYGNDVVAESCEMNADVQESKGLSMTHSGSGVEVNVTLEKEEVDAAEFLVEVKKDNHDLMKQLIKTPYNEKRNFKCTANDIDAEVTLVAVQVPVAAQ